MVRRTGKELQILVERIEGLDLAPANTTASRRRNGAPRQHGDLKRIVGGYQSPILWRAVLQIATSFGGYIACCTAMYLLYPVSYWWTLALAPLAAGFLVRIFIIQHDCGHASFFRSRRATEVVGWACSLFTLTPYTAWRRQHKGHHTIWNHLDRRQSGVDIYSTCLTVAEYDALGVWGKRRYRLARNPLVVNLLLPPFVFLILYRLPFDMPKSWRRERRDVGITNVALLLVYAGLGLAVGFGALAAVQLPVIALGAIAGIGLFSLQHRGETVVWFAGKDWDAANASLQGATYLRLSRVLQWFTGNIGFHHVHHLNHRVPNYRLQRSHEAISAQLPQVPTLSLWTGIKALRFALWDERRQRMVTFRQARRAAPRLAVAGAQSARVTP